MDECPKIFIKKNEYYLETSQNQKKDIIHKRLDEVNFSFRALNGLKNQNLIYLGDLVNYTEKQILAIPKLGRNSLNEIKQVLEELGLKLNMNLQNWPPKIIEKEIYNSKIEKREKFIELSLEQKYFISKILEETNLSVRAINCLRNLNCKYVGDIIHLGKEDIKRSHNMGKKSFNEIVSLIETAGMEIGENIEPWSYEIAESIRTYIEKNDKDDSAEKFVLQDKYLEVELHRVIKQLIIQRSSKLTGSAEESIERQTQVITSRYGLDGAPYKTLEVIGQKYNVTRERIRQIEAKGIKRLKYIRPITPILEKVFEELLKFLPITEIGFNKILKEKNLTKFDWDFKGLKDFYQIFGTTLDFYITKINNLRIITNDSKKCITTRLLNIISKKISGNGLFSISNCMQLKDIYLNNIKKETIIKIVQTKKNFNWLDNKNNWFTYYSERNRLSNLISKSAIASKIQNTEHLYNSIKNNPRIDSVFFCDKNVFVNFCKICFDCKSDSSNFITFNSSKSKLSNFKGRKGKMLAPNEQKLVNLFNDYGPILYIEDLKEFSKSQSVRSDSLNMILQFSPIFYRIDKGFYTLSEKNKENKMEKLISIINVESSFFSKDECPAVKNKTTYIEVNQNGSLLKALPYQRPLRVLPDGSYGVVYKKQVYPIIKSLIEEDGIRKDKEID